MAAFHPFQPLHALESLRELQEPAAYSLRLSTVKRKLRYYREQAERCRKMAQTTLDRKAKQTLLGAAAEYDLLATAAEEGEARH